MVLVKMDKKLLGFVLIYFLMAFLGIRAFQYVWNSTPEDREKPAVSGEIGNSVPSLTAFLVSTDSQDMGKRDVEIFDIVQGKVVNKVSLSPEVREEAEKCLKGITGMYVKANAFPDKGHIMKITLEPPVVVQNQWLSSTVKELFVLFPDDAKPYLLVLDEKGRPLFFTFEGKTDAMSKLLQISPPL